MDLIQRKLTKSEWEGIEVPVSDDEKEILKLIKNGYNDVNIRYNNNPSLIGYMKIDVSDNMELYLFQEYFQEKIQSLIKKNDINIDYSIPTGKKNSKPKKGDLIRIKNINSSNTFPHVGKGMIFEFLLLDVITKLYSEGKEKSVFYYYTLKNLNRLQIKHCNPHCKTFVNKIISNLDNLMDMKTIVSRSQEMIEKNEYLLKYSDISLYDHQKKLFTAFKHSGEGGNPNNGKMVLYIAPTATGKTLSPIGLAEQYRIIFVCAARHVGLALAKSAISAGRKIALAFDCKDAEDVRLHYSAAKDFTRDRRSGAIRKVDNSVGDLVEIMICDIKSYLPAMYYMKAFNDMEDIIVYWDEPTITMDYDEHPFHEIIQNNWSKNLIPNIVLSSATLPKQSEIIDVISDYRGKHGGDILSIISHDCKKTIPLLTKKNQIALPHYEFSEYREVMRSVAHCEAYPTIMRYLDLDAIVDFIMYVDKKEYVGDRYKIDNYFDNIDHISMVSLKKYYLTILQNLDEDDYNSVFEHFSKLKYRQPKYNSNIHMVTSDAYTLTDGPTIYLADDVEKIARFCIQEAKIPDQIMKDIMEDIKYNNALNTEITKYEHDYEDATAKDEGKDNKMSDINRLSPEVRRLKEKIDVLRSQIKSTSLHDIFVPNRKAHLKQWQSSNTTVKNPFTCDIVDETVVRLMQLNDIDDNWKVLLLMGIGVFTNHDSITYTEIMKELAEKQKLFLIIASSDFIYGTNYQFCHGYIGKDLADMTQEKSIQAMGRVGRNKIQQEYTLRFRDDSLIRKLLLPSDNKPEVRNMNRLFNSYA